MAYVQRPDLPAGYVNVEVSPGSFIPMPLEIAEQSGHKPMVEQRAETSLFNSDRKALAFGDTPEDNSPYAENDTGSAGAPAAPPVQTDVGAGGSSSRGPDETAGRGQATGTDTQSGTAPQAAPEPKKSATDDGALRGGGRIGEVPDPIAGGYGGGGGYPRRRQIVQVSKGGDLRTSFARQPGYELPETSKNLLTPGGPVTEDAIADAGLTGEEADAADRGAIRDVPWETGLTGEEADAVPGKDRKDRRGIDRSRAGTLAADVYDANTLGIVDQKKQLLQQDLANIKAEQAAIAREEQRRVRVDQRLAELQDARRRQDAETEKLTPQTAREVWESKSTLQQIGSAIQMMLGGYLQGLQGREQNPGYQMVMQGIAQEVADQRARYEAAVAKGTEIRNDYSEALALYGTPEAAAAATEQAKLTAVRKLTENAAAEVGLKEYKQAAMLASQDFRRQQAELDFKRQQLERGYVIQESWNYQPPRFAEIGGPLSPEARQRQIRYRGRTYFVPSTGETRLKSLTENLSGLEHLDGELQRLEGLVAQSGKVGPQALDEIKQRINTAKQNIGATANMLLGQGAMSKDEIQMIDKRLGTADDLVRIEDGTSRVQETRGFFRRKADVLLRNNVTLDPEGTEFIDGGDQGGFQVDTGGP